MNKKEDLKILIKQFKEIKKKLIEERNSDELKSLIGELNE